MPSSLLIKCYFATITIFFFFCSNSLDGDCKKWRLFADFLNDTAMFLELTVPFFSSFSLQVLCVTTAMKAVVS